MTAAMRNPQVPEASRKAKATRLDGQNTHDLTRDLAEETPIAMVFDGSSAAIMMASPRDIADFAHGFALTEGFITSLDQIESFEIVAHEAGIEARFWLNSDRSEALQKRRRAMAGPIGCGLCGIDSLDQAARSVPSVAEKPLTLSQEELLNATEALRAHQPLHDETHAVHAAGFLIPGQGIVAAREDVGRHNALDKLIGALARQGIEAGAGAFVMTSRISLELVQKAAMAGAPALISVSAPTAHALRLAETAGLSLAAFARGGKVELYCHPERFAAG